MKIKDNTIRKGSLTIGSAGDVLPPYHYHFYAKNRPQMPVLPIVIDHLIKDIPIACYTIPPMVGLYEASLDNAKSW